MTPESVNSSTPDAGRAAEGVGFANVMRPIVRNHRIVIGIGVAVGVICGAWSITRERTWTSTASFMPESPRAQTSLSSLAVQFGVNIGSDAGQSLQFYTELLTSREILLAVAKQSYTGYTTDTRVAGDLATIYGIHDGSPELRRDDLLKRMRATIHATNSPKTGVISLAVSAPDAKLAQVLASREIGAVNEFNLNSRRSRAGAERQFLEDRLAGARSSLLSAQNRLQEFMIGNRTTGGSVSLTFERARLEQTVNVAQGQVTALNSVYEQARLEEVRNTPVITVVETPDVPARPDSRGGLSNTILGFMLGLLFASVAAVLGSSLRRRRAD